MDKYLKSVSLGTGLLSGINRSFENPRGDFPPPQVSDRVNVQPSVSAVYTLFRLSFLGFLNSQAQLTKQTIFAVRTQKERKKVTTDPVRHMVWEVQDTETKVEEHWTNLC